MNESIEDLETEEYVPYVSVKERREREVKKLNLV